MHVTHLSLADFRSYPAAELALEPGVTTIVGPNGQGKTNLVEAVHYLATLSSHRVAGDAPLVRSGCARALLRAQVAAAGRTVLLELEITPGKANRARVNRSPVSRPRDILGVLRTVVFAPEDLAMVKGDPGERRRFLDELLVARAPRLAAVRSEYDRVLRQRNALLKSAGPAIRAGRGDVATLEVWDEHLARAGGELWAARLRLVQDLQPLLDKAYASISPAGGAASAAYRSAAGAAATDGATAGGAGDAAVLAAVLREAVQEHRRQELERGVSLVGPHRDELVLTLGDLPARGYASHGESWSFAVALRLAAYHLLRGDAPSSGDPVLILDDVFAELDDRRRSSLAAAVVDAEQVLVTAAAEQDVPAGLTGARVEVSAGQVRRAR